MSKRSQDVNWKNATTISSEFTTEPLKGLWTAYVEARDATTLAFKKAAEENKLEAKEEAFKVGLIKTLKQMAPDNPNYAKLGMPVGKVRKIALKYGIAVSSELFDENAGTTKGSKKGVTL